MLLFERQVEVKKSNLFELPDLYNVASDLELFNSLFRAVDYSLYTYISATDLYKFVEDNLPGVDRYSIKYYQDLVATFAGRASQKFYMNS